MTNVIDFQSRQAAPGPETFEDDALMTKPERPPFSFDMTQADAEGFVSIDACVPLQLAVEFMALLAKHREGIGSTSGAGRRQSRKKATA